jgi:hypothetical protein
MEGEQMSKEYRIFPKGQPTRTYLHFFVAISVLIGFIVGQNPIVHAAWTDILEDADILKGVGESVPGGELSESKIIAGLKEALEIGTGNAVSYVSQLDGYYKNPDIRIPLPDNVQKAENLLRTVGFGSKVDAFEESMNRAAERAAPEARSLFVDAIKKMSISDARNILQGRDNEATLYFEDKTRGRLYELFKPIVHTAMSEVGVTQSYQELDTKVRSLPLGEKASFDLDDYVTNKGLDGLFFMVAQEERKIRQDPTARVTNLLEEVFGSR